MLRTAHVAIPFGNCGSDLGADFSRPSYLANGMRFRDTALEFEPSAGGETLMSQELLDRYQDLCGRAVVARGFL